MNNIFGPEKPLSDYNLWRAIVAAASIVIGTGVILVWEKLPQPSELGELSVVFETMASLTRVWGKTAGGVVIAPPVPMAPPQLPELTGQMLPAETFSAKSII